MTIINNLTNVVSNLDAMLVQESISTANCFNYFKEKKNASGLNESSQKAMVTDSTCEYSIRILLDTPLCDLKPESPSTIVPAMSNPGLLFCDYGYHKKGAIYGE